MTLIMIVLTMTVAILNMRRFGEGLMDKLDTASNIESANYNSYAFEAPTYANRQHQSPHVSPRQRHNSHHRR